jgi:protein SCO1
LNIRRALIATLIVSAIATVGAARYVSRESSRVVSDDEHVLATIGPAPEFALNSQDGTPVTLRALRGKVVVVTFIFASCSSTCPLLTAKMVQVQDELRSDFGSRIAFISITVDPDHDTPEVLRHYAEAYGVDLRGWSFLTGPPLVVRDVIRRYGVFASKSGDDEVNHTNLTSLIDRRGTLRVQYLGIRFDPEEFRHDLLSLADEL